MTCSPVRSWYTTSARHVQWNLLPGSCEGLLLEGGCGPLAFPPHTRKCRMRSRKEQAIMMVIQQTSSSNGSRRWGFQASKALNLRLALSPRWLANLDSPHTPGGDQEVSYSSRGWGDACWFSLPPWHRPLSRPKSSDVPRRKWHEATFHDRRTTARRAQAGAEPQYRGATQGRIHPHRSSIAPGP